MPFHALDHGIERALPFGGVLVVELVLHAASQQGVYQETAAAGHQPRSPARTAFEYALELVGVYEIVDAPVDFGQHLAVGLDIGRRAVVYDQPLRGIVADKLRFIDPAGDFALLDIPENLLFHRGDSTAAPHVVQNFASSSSGALHFGHTGPAGAAATGVPHVVQNFASSRISELQFWHFIVVVLFG